MIGGRVIENAVVKTSEGRQLRRLWVVDSQGGTATEAALYTLPDSADNVEAGDEVWKQAGKLYHGDTHVGPHLGIRYDPPWDDTMEASTDGPNG